MNGTALRWSHMSDDGGLGKLSMHLNEDVEDEVVADVI